VTGEWLIWSEPVGADLLVVFAHGHDGAETRVGLLTPRRRFRPFASIPPLSRRTLTKLPFPLKATRRDDQYTLAHRAGIRVAEMWVLKLKEQHAPKAAPCEG
jgi:hypothetical protein